LGFNTEIEQKDVKIIYESNVTFRTDNNKTFTPLLSDAVVTFLAQL
jgi:hypothetical protein